MLDLKDAARLARSRIEARLVAANKNNKKGLPKSVAIVQQGSSFRAHLLAALRRGGDERQFPSPAPDALFLAFPEKLLGKWYYLAYGAQRDSQSSQDKSLEAAPEWRAWDNIGAHSRITNFARSEPSAVLIAHGLSAIEDSTLLLADIGRGFRTARSMHVPLRILLADISWISYNRSLRRFDLDDAAIENGLRLCQDRRQRLYEGIAADAKVHAIVPYQKRGAISSQKIQMIAARYVALAETLWGSDKVATALPLDNSHLAAIGRSLQLSVGTESPLQFLMGFPGALGALEKALAPHLNVIRTVAQRFRMLSVDTFSYYFAQYYAQDGYRGTHVKVAPVSERDFDEPYDELDESFRSWGDGHDPEVTSSARGQTRKRRMTAVYLPQYTLGDWELLPYSPLSLAAVSKSGGSVAAVREHVILLSDRSTASRAKVERILRATLARTGCIQLNRLVMDVLSFLQAAVLSSGRGRVDAILRSDVGNLDDILTRIDGSLPEFFAIECEESVELADLWLSWLDAVDRDVPLQYAPSHLIAACRTGSDWTDDALAAATDLLISANRVAWELSE